MNDATPSPTQPADLLPDPERVRDRLAALHAEARVLKRLLQLCVMAEEERASLRRSQRQEVAHVA